MISVPSYMKGRRAAIAAVAVAGALFLLLVVAPLAFVLFAQSDAESEALNQLAHYRAEIAARPALEAELANLREKLSTVPGAIAGDSAALAQAQLQSDVKSLVENNAGAVRSAQILPVSDASGFDVIAIQYEITLPITHLRDLLYATEAHSPYLFIDNVDIAMQQDWRPAEAQTPEPVLLVRWTVRAYHWNGAKS